MARFKDTNYHQTTLVAISHKDQLQPGTFEYAIDYLIENKLDLTLFYDRYKNEETGASAYNPGVLLKVVLLAYSRGMTSSRKIDNSCKTNATFMALSGFNEPHFTTIAKFVSTLSKEINELFQQVLLICDKSGLIGKNMFAIDGCKLPSNASKEWSGTHEELARKKAKMEKAIERMLTKHREMDDSDEDEVIKDKEQQQIQTLEKNANKIQSFLENQTKKIGRRGKELKSNITDNDSAKMKTSHGVIQGYNGIVAVDDKHQIILHAEAFGEGQDHQLLKPTLEGVKTNLNSLAAYPKTSPLKGKKLAADAGFHNEANIQQCANEGIDAYIADNKFRKRDPRFADAEHYNREKNAKKKSTQFSNEDFIYDENKCTCICPAGVSLALKTTNAIIDNTVYVTFHGYRKDCRPCHLRSQCLRNPDQIDGRQVAFKKHNKSIPITLTQKMKEKIDTEQGRFVYSQRLGIVEPVFGNIRETKGLRRFGLRGKTKVDTQWKLYCLVHNIEKIKNYAMAC